MASFSDQFHNSSNYLLWVLVGMENGRTFAVRNKKRCGFLETPAKCWDTGSKKDFRKSPRVLQVSQFIVHLPPDREIGNRRKVLYILV